LHANEQVDQTRSPKGDFSYDPSVSRIEIPGVSGKQTLCDGTGDVKVIERKDLNRALAKTLAYHQCGQQSDALRWSRKLSQMLEEYLEQPRDFSKTKTQSKKEESNGL